MKNILHNWWGWLLLIIAARLLFVFFGSPTTAPDEAIIKNALTIAIHDENQSVRASSSKVLHESLLAFPKHRQWILKALNKASEQQKNKQEIKDILALIDQDPLYQLSIAVEKPNLPFFFYISPLLLAIPFIYGVIFLLFIPLFISYVVGVNATIKLYGKKRKPFIYTAIILIWIFAFCSLSYYKQTLFIAHSLLLAASLILLFLLTSKKLLALFLDVSQKTCWIIFAGLFIAGLISLAPYFESLINAAPQIKTSQGKILKAIESLKEDHYKKAKPLLAQILRKKVHQSPKITQKAIEQIGIIGDYSQLEIIHPFLTNKSPIIRKAALEASLKIIKKFTK